MLSAKDIKSILIILLSYGKSIPCHCSLDDIFKIWRDGKCAPRGLFGQSHLCTCRSIAIVFLHIRERNLIVSCAFILYFATWIIAATACFGSENPDIAMLCRSFEEAREGVTLSPTVLTHSLICCIMRLITWCCACETSH